MQTIYWSHTPLVNVGPGGQSLDATLVVTERGRTYRVTLHWDHSYSFQSRGEIAVLEGASFKTVLYLHHHDMERFAAHDKLEPPIRGEFKRAGKMPGLIRTQADELAALGSKIVTSAS